MGNPERRRAGLAIACVVALCAAAARSEDVETPGFDPTAAPADAGRPDPIEQWKAEAADVQALIAGATTAGVGAGRHERINVRVGGRSSPGSVVSADDAGIGVLLEGLTLALTWERLAPEQYYALARAYLPDESLVHGALARYCAVHGMLADAEAEVARALGTDLTAWALVRPVSEYLKEKRRAGSAARAGRAPVEAPSKQPATSGASVRRGHAGAAGREHPYLYFGAADVPALRAKTTRPGVSKRWNVLVAHARRCLPTTPRSGRGMAMTRPSLGIAANTAFAYAVTGERPFAERAIAEALMLVDAGSWNPDGHANTKGADLGCGEGSLACGLVYDWCFDAMSPEQRDRLKRGIMKLGVETYLTSIKARDWWVDNYVTNWNGVCHGGCGVAALALSHEDDRAREAAETAWKHTKTFVAAAVLEDGGGHEGIMYHHYGLEFALFLAAAAERSLGGGEVIDDAAMRFGGYWDAYLQGPDLAFANFNDMDEGTFRGLWGRDGSSEAGPRAACSALFDSRLAKADPLLLWVADNGGCGYMYGGSSPFPILFRRDAPEATKKPALRDAVLFRGAGHVVWQSPSLWFAFNGGWISDKSHNNCDLGSFVLVAGTDRVIGDPGYGKRATAEHSTVVIDGKDQRIGSRGTYLRYGSGRGFHYLASDLTACYASAGRVVRHAVMVRGSYVVLFDDIATEGAAKVECRFQTTGEIQTAQGTAATIAGVSGGRLAIAVAWPRDASVSRGKASIAHVIVAPPRAGYTGPIVTVLAPGATVPATRLEPAGGTATLVVANASGRDELVFAQSGGFWLLSEVNGESARQIGPPGDRVVERAVAR